MDPSNQARLFLALWPDLDVVQALNSARQEWRWPPSALLVGPQRLHLTMHFLGQVDNHLLASLKQSLAVPFQPFALEFGRAELWRGGIAVLRPVAAPAAMTALRSRLTEALLKQGISVQVGTFKPHVTLARQAQGVELPTTPLRFRWRVSSYSLVQSLAGPPASYSVLHSWPVPQ